MFKMKHTHLTPLVIGVASLFAVYTAVGESRAVVYFDSALLQDAAAELNLNVYDSPDAVVPLASQSYQQKDLVLPNDGDVSGLSTLEVVFSNVEPLLLANDIWVEPEISGVVVGVRQPVRAVDSSMVVEGPIESRGVGGGFVFPDTSVQASAFTGEVDPTVNSQVKDGVSWLEVADRPAGLDDGDDVGITSETDPQVGTNSTNYLPKWNGSSLISGTVFDNGNIGIGTDAPQTRLHVLGGISLNSTVFTDVWTIGTADDHFTIRDVDNPLPRLAIHQDTGKISVGSLDVVSEVSIGSVTPDPAMALQVGGFSEFNIGSGKLYLTTPGGRPGIIAFSNTGNRRDIVFHDDFLALNVSDSGAIPALASGITITNDGNVGIGTNSPTAMLEVNGWTKTSVIEITGGMDLSERFSITERDTDSKIVPGMVLSIDPTQAGELQLSREPYDKRVAGVVSGAGGVNPGLLMGQNGSPVEGNVPVALTGRVYVWADAVSAAIEPGDLLTTSTVPGHAMKVQNPAQAQGAILGKAMTELKDGRGLVLVLVSLQ